jgi:putative restriction endonuclease
MTILALLENSDWDKPFFKVLAPNDTGGSVGHQGGMVIPQALRPFFPGLTGVTSASSPTIDRHIIGDLYDGTTFLSRVRTRYQFQTWGGERSPESRLTSNLTDIRNKAVGGDILLIQRSILDLELYRLVLVRKKTADYKILEPLIAGRRWGVLGTEAPMSAAEYDTAQEEEVTKEAAPFNLFDTSAKPKETRSISVARSVVFRNTLQRIYENKCSVCGNGLRVPNGPSEMHAAHIVPRSINGADDARNGLGLCRTHHWAFDEGLFGIDRSRKIWVPQSVCRLSENKPLASLAGQLIRNPTDAGLTPDNTAFEWHMKNIVLPS